MANVDELIQVQAARVACQQITGPVLNRLVDSVVRACWRHTTAAQANRAWIRETLWRTDRQFAELLEHVVSTELACDPACAAASRSFRPGQVTS